MRFLVCYYRKHSNKSIIKHHHVNRSQNRQARTARKLHVPYAAQKRPKTQPEARQIQNQGRHAGRVGPGQLTFFWSDWGAGWCAGGFLVLRLILISRYILLQVWMNIEPRKHMKTCQHLCPKSHAFPQATPQHREKVRAYHRINPKNLRSDKPHKKKAIISLIGEINKRHRRESGQGSSNRRRKTPFSCPRMGSSDWRIELPEQCYHLYRVYPQRSGPQSLQGFPSNFHILSAPHPITL